MSPPLEILFEDDHCLVINKPAGLSTQAPRGIDALEVQVRAYLQSVMNADMAYWQCDPSGQAPAVYLGLPHRLDRPVTGVIVLAKTKKGARKISKQFERRQVKKLYWAAVEGMVQPEAGTWIDWLRKCRGSAGGSGRGKSSGGAAGCAALSDAGENAARIVVGSGIGNRTDASDSGAGGDARTSGAGGCTIWKPDNVRHAI